ncbi:hypothetical protein [Rasiella sp. SM2506]|uniref:hypothetical protein n=1 Tax=Rasiella sp. SM2506 TaxID=3423914 RepID=UPI003D7B23C1
MNYRPYWQFYKAIFPFVVATGLLTVWVFGVYWGYFLFCTLGIVAGFFGFKTFRKDEYYSYYNLGITKYKLLLSSIIINLLVGLPIFLVFLALFLVIFGKTSSI